MPYPARANPGCRPGEGSARPRGSPAAWPRSGRALDCVDYALTLTFFFSDPTRRIFPFRTRPVRPRKHTKGAASGPCLLRASARLHRRTSGCLQATSPANQWCFSRCEAKNLLNLPSSHIRDVQRGTGGGSGRRHAQPRGALEGPRPARSRGSRGLHSLFFYLSVPLNFP